MSKKWGLVYLAIAVVALASRGARSADPVVYYTFDDLGAVVPDKSGHGHDGISHGGIKLTDPGYVGKCFAFNGTDSYVQLPRPVQDNFTLSAWIKTSVPGLAGTQAYEGSGIIWSDVAGVANDYVFAALGTKLSFFCGNPDTSVNSNGDIVTGQWVHIAGVRDTKAKTISVYINGKLDNSVSHSNVASLNGNPNMAIGANTLDSRYFTGLIDEVKIYDVALTAAEIQSSMRGPVLAGNVSPADGATDVPRDATLNWKAGQYPSIHDVYFGTVFADVNSASRTAAKGVLVSQGQADTTFDPPGSLAYGQTYYWRIDEVNKSPDATVSKGTIWSFTAEPYGYPITGVTATASSALPSSGPENTINGSGLTGDQHGTDGPTMWMTTGLVLPNWIQYQFDKVYKLNDLKVWNSNQGIEAYIGFGAKDVQIEYSTDGATWTTLANVPQFARAPGLPTYTANTTVQFGGVLAQYVKLTINSSWGGLPQTGLSEVRFSYVPVQARAPQPANAATGVNVSSSLNWRPGREAGSHKVFFGTDQAAVTSGTVAAQTVTDHSFTPASLLFGATYYWRVDEVNTITYPGDVWSFTTQEFAAVDDFESYNDDKNCIFDTWIDGYTDGKSGSVVGYMQAPFAETTIVHGGKQSMPLEYNNVKTPFYSETTRDLGMAQDWTGNGATHLDLWFRGYPALNMPVTVTTGALTLTGDGTDIWNNADDFAFAYKTLTGDGSIIARVLSVGTGTNTWAKGGVMIRGDLTAGSTFVNMVMTGSSGNGASFQYRLTAAGACANTDAAAALPVPYWVKLTRTGSVIAGYVSADGKTWTQQGTSQTITMANPVDIGLCVCAHQAGEYRTMQFDNITTTGNVGSTWQGVQINSSPHNDPAGLYVVVTDNAGKSKLEVHADPAATNAANWTQWTIPLSDLTAAGVKTTKIQKITIGVGDKNNSKAGGAGMLFIDDIGYGHPAAK